MSYPNRNWIIEDQRLSVEFAGGMTEFMAIARQHVNIEGRVKCPCKRCNNVLMQKIPDIENHLFIRGFKRNYTRWNFHREEEDDVMQYQTNYRGGGGMFDAVHDILDHNDVDGDDDSIDPNA